jgi:hypothetical protein
MAETLLQSALIQLFLVIIYLFNVKVMQIYHLNIFHFLFNYNVLLTNLNPSGSGRVNIHYFNVSI